MSSDHSPFTRCAVEECTALVMYVEGALTRHPKGYCIKHKDEPAMADWIIRLGLEMGL